MENHLLNDSIRQQVKELFQQLKEPVAVLFFGSQADCAACGDTYQLASELVELSEKLSLASYDIDADADMASLYKVDKVPGLVLAARDGNRITDYGIRFAGIPSGHEFASLVHDLVLVSSRDSGLDPLTRDFLKSLTKPVHLQVFVTPT
jgi:alkyl hydroperoxide reductase subunit AhpF